MHEFRLRLASDVISGIVTVSQSLEFEPTVDVLIAFKSATAGHTVEGWREPSIQHILRTRFKRLFS